jgi:hypothetical protein
LSRSPRCKEGHRSTEQFPPPELDARKSVKPSLRDPAGFGKNSSVAPVPSRQSPAFTCCDDAAYNSGGGETMKHFKYHEVYFDKDGRHYEIRDDAGKHICVVGDEVTADLFSRAVAMEEALISINEHVSRKMRKLAKGGKVDWKAEFTVSCEFIGMDIIRPLFKYPFEQK